MIVTNLEWSKYLLKRLNFKEWETNNRFELHTTFI